MLDPDAVDEALGARYLGAATERFGPDGEEAIIALLSAVREMYAWLDPALLEGAAVVVAMPRDAIICPSPPARTHPHLGVLPPFVQSEVTVQPMSTGGWRIWTEVIDPTSLVDAFVAYVFRGPGSEFILIGDDEFEVPRLELGQSSQFAAGTFFDLDEVLDDYEFRYARLSQCEILQTAWRTTQRLMFVPRPEDVMQKSLHNHIKHRLRGNITPRARREIYEDIGERVDIEVSWPMTNRVAIVEIKWMGKSAPAGQSNPFTQMSAADALDGATQLARYLDVAKADAPDHQFQGTLAVFDGRRRNVSAETDAVTLSDGMYYEHEHVEIDVTIEARPDFRRMLRFFLEPVCTA